MKNLNLRSATSKCLSIFSIILITLTTYSCKKSAPPAPATPPPVVTPSATMTADYSAGTYSGTGSSFNNSLLAVNQSGSQYGIQGKITVSGHTLTIYIVAGITGTGTINLGANGSNNYAQFIDESTTPQTVYATTGSSPNTGTLTITSFSTSSRLISGTFSYMGGVTSGPGTAVVTNGSFSNVRF